MRFTETNLKGAFVIELDEIHDERGFFARSFCREEFLNHGLNPNIAQCNLSQNIKKGTLRGMHYQVKPYEEVKLVRCVRGKIFDVMVDLREGSETKLKYFALELSGENGKALYIPEGFAHGFLSLEDNSLVLYQVSAPYAPKSQGAVRYNDPDINIKWPDTPLVISEKDKNAPLYRELVN